MTDEKPMVIVTDAATLRRIVDEAVRAALEAAGAPGPTPVTIDAEDVAQMLGVTSRQVRNLATNGDLPATKVGSRWRFRHADVVAYLEPDAA
jgi:excisionase family DNA binding protein